MNDPAYRTNRAGPQGPPVHDRSIETHLACCVRQPTQPDRVVSRIPLDDPGPHFHRIQHTAAALQNLHRRWDSNLSILAAED